jgi:hypothetical protein
MDEMTNGGDEEKPALSPKARKRVWELFVEVSHTILDEEHPSG